MKEVFHMKKRKVLSFLTAAVLTVGAVPFSVIHAAAADETYVQGDVDMDGYITGHDAAMVSRYLNVDPELLSDQQKALADITVTAWWIRATQMLFLRRRSAA